MKRAKLLAILIAMVMLVMGCTVTSGSQDVSTYTPTEIQVSASTTLTATLQPTFTNTPLPAFTSTPRPSFLHMNDDGKGHQWCDPVVVRAGHIIVDRAIGRWTTKEKAISAVGDTWPPIIANGQPLVVTNLEKFGAEWHTNGTDDPSPGWGFHVTVDIQLSPGVYDLSSLWLHDLKTCTITVK